MGRAQRRIPEARLRPEKDLVRRRVQRLLVGGASNLAVVLGVSFGSFRGVMGSVMMMAVGDMRVMSGQVVIAGFMVARGFAMMAGCVFMMFGCFQVMLNCFSGHRDSLSWRSKIGRAG
jgi:hypothetical protein